MSLNIKSFLFLCLSFLVVPTALQAIGGSEFERVSGEEVKRKGILKIEVGKELQGTAVLFKEGTGSMALSVRLALRDCESKLYTAHWGNQQRKIKRVIRPKNPEVALVLLVFEDPFEDVESLPCLPVGGQPRSLYEECFYGYGETNAACHPGFSNNSGICRKGKQKLALISALAPDISQEICKTGKSRLTANDLISFMPCQKAWTPQDTLVGSMKFLKNFAESLSQKSEADLAKKSMTTEKPVNDLAHMILNQRILPLKNDKPLLSSAQYLSMRGDIGAPFIGAENEIQALIHTMAPFWQENKVTLAFESPISALLGNPKIFRSNTFELSCGSDISIESYFFFFEGIGNLFMEMEDIIKGKDISMLNNTIEEIDSYMKTQLQKYYVFSDRTVFHKAVEQEEGEPENERHITRWLEKNRLFFLHAATPLCAHRVWIDRAIKSGFEQSQEKS